MGGQKTFLIRWETLTGTHDSMFSGEGVTKALTNEWFSER